MNSRFSSTDSPLEISPGVHLAPEGALLLPGEGLLAVADLHAGRASATQRHWLVPPTDKLVGLTNSLLAIIGKYEPRIVLVNGDFKHGFRPAGATEAREVREAAEAITASGRTLLVARGNHDRGLDDLIGGLPRVSIVDRHDAAFARFAHGHARVARPRRGWLVLGHEHPAIHISDAVGAGARVPAFLVSAKRRVIVLPAISPWAAGVDPRSRGFASPVLSGTPPGDFDAYAVHAGELLPFGNLGALARTLRESAVGKRER